MARQDDAANSVRLRLRAEEMVRARATAWPGTGEALSSEETARVLHELRVHEIQLEMQNEELRRAQAELDAARERYFDLYNLAPVGYCTLSEDGLILETNLTATNLLGVPRSVIAGQPFSRFISHEHQDMHYRYFKQLRETGGPLAWELRLLRKDSAPFWARVEATFAPDGSGVSVCRAVISDIAERKLREEEKAELEARNRELELSQGRAERLAQHRLESVGTLASGIAHDINNLLGVVLAQSELALAELAAGSLPEAELNQIRAVAVRGSEIGRQLMIYAGDESEALVLVGVSRTIEDMLELLKVSVSKHVLLETSLEPNLPPIAASPAQLRRVVMNLVTNASEAIGTAEGVIRLATREVTVGPDWARSSSEDLVDGKYAELEVTDTGRGMAPETQGRVFDMLFTTKSSGRGLGLPVVQEIVRSLRGAIRLKSSPGSGTTFQIFLPCAGDPGQIPPEILSPAEEPQQIGAGTVLIVEDEAALRQPSSKILRNAGYSVFEAGDGDRALEVIRACQSRICVLLLDITLPGASSREVFEEASRLRPDMKVIVTSAYSAAAAAVALGGRVDRFLRKPYRLSDLTALVTDARGEQQP
jgi:PAS domain S-box-containing protein